MVTIEVEGDVIRLSDGQTRPIFDHPKYGRFCVWEQDGRLWMWDGGDPRPATQYEATRYHQAQLEAMGIPAETWLEDMVEGEERPYGDIVARVMQELRFEGNYVECAVQVQAGTYLVDLGDGAIIEIDQHVHHDLTSRAIRYALHNGTLYWFVATARYIAS